MTRLAVIVIDAAESSVVERFMDAGHLPNLRSLSHRSARFELNSPLPYRSEMVWTRFLTGQDSEHLGYWTQLEFDPLTYKSRAVGAAAVPPFFADRMPGKRVIAFDLIHSALHEVNGVHVTAWGSHSPQYPRASFPPGLLTRIDRRFGTNPAFNNDFEIGWFEPDYIRNLTEAAKVGTRRRTEIVKWLMQEEPDWDVLVTCISEIHSGGHHFWHGVDERHPLHEAASTSSLAGEKMLELFKEADRSVGELIEAMPEDTTVLVCALHGMKPADDTVASAALSEMLARHHLGRRFLSDPDQEQWRRSGYPPVVPPRHSSWYHDMKRKFTGGPVDHLRHIVEAAPRPIADLARLLAGRGRQRRLGELHSVCPPEYDSKAPPPRRNAPMSVVDWYRPYWQRMPWFATPTFADGHVRLNVAGREAHGMIEPADFYRVRDEAVRFLMGCKDPRTGQPAVVDVLPVHGSDPLERSGPDADLIVIFSGALDSLEHEDVGLVGPYPHMRTGSHSNVGWAMVAGPGIAATHHGATEAKNLTATVLELAGCSVPTDVVGTSLGSILSTTPKASALAG
jgi:predicted AlkP superfamily phosphohydrolase/phosphomutase